MKLGYYNCLGAAQPSTRPCHVHETRVKACGFAVRLDNKVDEARSEKCCRMKGCAGGDYGGKGEGSNMMSTGDFKEES